jgi:hypothetical protein
LANEVLGDGEINSCLGTYAIAESQPQFDLDDIAGLFGIDAS